jgi:hypothetical protein
VLTLYSAVADCSKKTSTSLNKLLVSLRVTLSTAKIAFLHEFVDLSGLDALGETLHRLLSPVIEAGSVAEQNVVEVIKCLRVLMNTDVSNGGKIQADGQSGFTGVLDRPILLARIAETFHIPTLRSRCQSADLLSALSVLSPHEGYELVLSALSDMRGPYNNLLRFQWLVDSLDAARGYGEDMPPGQGRRGETDGVWEWRVAVLGLLNAVANTSDGLEGRCEIRGELDRRGLGTAMEVSRVE